MNTHLFSVGTVTCKEQRLILLGPEGADRPPAQAQGPEASRESFRMGVGPNTFATTNRDQRVSAIQANTEKILAANDARDIESAKNIFVNMLKGNQPFPRRYEPQEAIDSINAYAKTGGSRLQFSLDASGNLTSKRADVALQFPQNPNVASQPLDVARVMPAGTPKEIIDGMKELLPLGNPVVRAVVEFIKDKPQAEIVKTLEAAKTGLTAIGPEGLKILQKVGPGALANVEALTPEQAGVDAATLAKFKNAVTKLTPDQKDALTRLCPLLPAAPVEVSGAATETAESKKIITGLVRQWQDAKLTVDRVIFEGKLRMTGVDIEASNLAEGKVAMIAPDKRGWNSLIGMLQILVGFYDKYVAKHKETVKKDEKTAAKPEDKKLEAGEKGPEATDEASLAEQLLKAMTDNLGIDAIKSIVAKAVELHVNLAQMVVGVLGRAPDPAKALQSILPALPNAVDVLKNVLPSLPLPTVQRLLPNVRDVIGLPNIGKLISTLPTDGIRIEVLRSLLPTLPQTDAQTLLKSVVPNLKDIADGITQLQSVVQGGVEGILRGVAGSIPSPESVIGKLVSIGTLPASAAKEIAKNVGMAATTVEGMLTRAAQEGGNALNRARGAAGETLDAIGKGIDAGTRSVRSRVGKIVGM